MLGLQYDQYFENDFSVRAYMGSILGHFSREHTVVSFIQQEICTTSYLRTSLTRPSVINRSSVVSKIIGGLISLAISEERVGSFFTFISCTQNCNTIMFHFRIQQILSFAVLICISNSSDACVDDDARIAEVAAANGIEDISACVDVSNQCGLQDQRGEVLRSLCCATCAENENLTPVESELPPTDETVHVFLQAGQSECGGSANPVDLNADSKYANLHGDIDDVWFAGYKGKRREEGFFVAPMSAGVASLKFGPEVSFGERFHSITGKRTLILKYCMGGTNVHTHWNPDTPENSWDTEADDGTAQWMSENAGIDFSSKDHLFKITAYSIRRLTETLTDGGVPFEWEGIIWVQGNADDTEGDPVWKAFGENTARVWDGFRTALGTDVPIIDQGSSVKSQLKSGKEYATKIVKGCKAKNIEWARSSNEESSDCIIGPSNPCLGDPGLHTNFDFYDFYGYDPALPDDLKPEDASDKIFRWWVSFPTNLHSGYEGMILKGQTLANNFITEFTDYDLPSEFADVDPVIQFPWPACADGSTPSADNFCWVDYQDETLMVEQCTLSNDSNESFDEDDDDDVNSAASAQYMGFLSSICALTIGALLSL